LSDPAGLSGTLASFRTVLGRVIGPADFERYEAAIGLPSPQPALRDGIVTAVYSCLLVNSVLPLKRYSDIREELTAIEKNARAAAGALNDLRASLDRLSPAIKDPLQKIWALSGGDLNTLSELARRFCVLSSIAKQTAPSIQDRGGRPRKLPFQTLINVLADAYETATDQGATVSTLVSSDPTREQYTGPFVALVEAVWADGTFLAKQMAKPLDPIASKDARGQYIKAVLRARRERDATR
jgi:hypothetical protein